MYKKILIGMDESDDAVHAAIKAIEYQKRDDSEVVAFHSVIHHLSEINPTFSYLGRGTSAISLTIHEDYIKRGERILENVEKLFNESNAKIETRLILDILPEEYIKKIVEKEKFDLVILGCKGHHSKISRTFLGTIPDKVINNSSSDVLIVR